MSDNDLLIVQAIWASGCFISSAILLYGIIHLARGRR